MTLRRTAALLAMVAMVAVALVGCGDPARPSLGDRVPITTAPAPETSTTPPAPETSSSAPGPGTSSTAPAPETSSSEPADPSPTTGPPPEPTVVATAHDDLAGIAVFDGPGGTATNMVPNPGEYGQAQVFLVHDQAEGFVEVDLPIRPNGSTGWISAEDVTLTQHDWRIEVSLSGFELRLLKGSETMLTSPVGVGRTDRPTPGGEYYTWVLLDPTNNGYGDYAYGLSGFSEALETFAGGDARLGLHGTDDESTIGTAVSSGCIRLPNPIVSRMVEEIGLPLGVPVEVTA